MKLGLLISLDKRYTTSRKIHANLESANYRVIDINVIYGQFEAIRKRDSKGMAYKS